MHQPIRTMVIAGLCLFAGAAHAQNADGVKFASAAELKAMLAKVGPTGSAVAQVPTAPGARVAIVRRDKDSEPEAHGKLSDQIVVREGKASMLIGGTLSGDRLQAPDERRGGTITGGTLYPLEAGDTILVPPGVPHRVLVPAVTSFVYMAIKF